MALHSVMLFDVAVCLLKDDAQSVCHAVIATMALMRSLKKKCPFKPESDCANGPMRLDCSLHFLKYLHEPPPVPSLSAEGRYHSDPNGEEKSLLVGAGKMGRGCSSVVEVLQLLPEVAVRLWRRTALRERKRERERERGRERES